ncbi:MAG: DegV family protein [Ruminococcaceae bacterium]|nr:DegV family protein [Oscillospiraceae bacterium]
MSKIKIMCTSTGCIEYAPERYREMDIEIIRVLVHFNGKEYKEGIGLDPVEFYNFLETVEDPKSNLPHTDMPNTEDIRAAFDKAIADGYDEAIVFAISAGLGGTYNKICLVAKEYEGKLKINVVDTEITCFGEGLLAIKAYEFAQKGMSSEDILKEINWMKRHQELIGIDGKLDYLIYNGRLKGGKAFMGQLLNICPVIHMDKGEIVPLESVRTQKKALARTCELLKEKLGDRNPEDYVLWHIYTGRSVIDKLLEIEKKYDIKTNHEDVIMSPVSGCHNGPWLAAYGYTFLRREDEPLED